jgi:predicted PurR-regulated permease PerM
MVNKISPRVIYVYIAVVMTLVIVYFAKPVLMPLAIAAVLAIVFTPLCGRLEKAGINPTLSAILCGLIFALLFGGVVFFVVFYFKQIVTDLSGIKQHIAEYNQYVRKYLHDNFGVNPQGGKSSIPVPFQPDGEGLGRVATSLMGLALSLVIDLVLINVYLIMLLCIRGQIKLFILRLVWPAGRDQVKAIISRCASVVRNYLVGLAIVIVFLWVMYSIGFSIVGIHYALFFAILCGLLEIVPFVGNITGSTLTSIMALSQGGGMGMVAGVLITYALIQFIQFYIITPLVMRDQVHIHPIFTILILITGDLIWGIPGMILAIPLLGIVKIVCDNVESLAPLGHLLGHHRKRRQNK